MRRSPLLLLPTALASAAIAVAAGGGSVQTTLTPDSVSAPSKVTVNARGPFSSAGGLPKSVKLQVQKGFKSSAKSVPVLCSAKQENSGDCPSKSKVGSGTAKVTGQYSVFGPEQDTIHLTFYLGAPRHSGDIASVAVVGTDTLFNQTAHAVGRLFVPSAGGLELLFSRLPPVQVPSGTKVTVNSLSLSAHAFRTVTTGPPGDRHTVHYSLITNPPTCSGHWTGTLTVTFTSGSLSRSLSAACTS